MKEFIEPLKEAGRVVVLAIIPLLITSLEMKKFDWVSIGVVAAIAFLKFIDKYFHDKEPKGVAGGLTRF
jgi:hypothetical protein